MDDALEIKRDPPWDGVILEEHFIGGELVRRLRFRGAQLISDMRFGAGGRPHGLAREWYVTGELKRERTFEAGVGATGELRSWHRNGRLRERRERQDHRWIGTHEKFHRDGSIRMRGQWHEGLRTGTWSWYHPNGALYLQVSYLRGSVDGCVRLWRSTGEVVLEVEVRPHGPLGPLFDGVQQLGELQFVEGEPRVVAVDEDQRPVAALDLWWIDVTLAWSGPQPWWRLPQFRRGELEDATRGPSPGASARQ